MRAKPGGTESPMSLLFRSSAAGTCLAATLMLFAGGCGDENPMMETDAGAFDAGVRVDARVVPDGSIFCEADEECDDGIDCTEDSCGTNGICRFLLRHAACDDGIFCNGVEQCDPRVGCVAGLRQTCNDDDVCTIDRCDEEGKVCLHSDRDLDEDGDPDWFCAGGGDCDDNDPAVSAMVSEVCDDGRDNDCDEMIDEEDCGVPRHDTCDDPLDVSAGGSFVLNTDGTSPDYSLSCSAGTFGARDMVAVFTLAERQSVTIEAEGDFLSVPMSLRTTCPDGGSELTCESALLRRRSLEPGTYFLVLSARLTTEIVLDVEFGPPIDPPTNDTCASPVDVSAGGTFMGSFVEVADDLASECSVGSAPDLVYELTTTEEQDLVISATSPTGGNLSYSVRTACDDDATQVRCAYGSPATGRIHQLPAGTYYIIVEGSASRDDDFTLDVQVLPPTAPAAGDTCTNAIPLTAGTEATGMLTDKENDIEVSCGFRYRDAVYTFTLAEASDVTLELDTSSFANMTLRPQAMCESTDAEISCTSGDPIYQRHRNLSAGTYSVIVESRTPSGFTVRYDATSPPTTPVAVTNNDNCTSAYVIPTTGGIFQGDTTSMLPDLSATCGAGAGSKDAVFQLALDATKRVVMTTEGSDFDTVLHVHNGPTCMDGGDVYCNDDQLGVANTSFLDLTLAAGTYYIVVDGWGSSSAGEYTLEVVVRDP